MITDPLPITTAFAAFLSSMHVGSRRSFWYHVDDRTADDPTNVKPDIQPDDDPDLTKNAINAANIKKQHLEILNLTSLRKQTCLPREQYHNMLLTIGLLQKFGAGYRVNGTGWTIFLEGLDIDAEFSDSAIWKSIVGGSKRYYIRVGPKNNGQYNKNIEDQMTSETEWKSPRFGGKAAVRTNLANAFHADGSGDASDAYSTSDTNDVSSESESDRAHHNNSSQASSNNTRDSNVSLLSSLGISNLSPEKIQVLIGELVNLQASSAVPSTSAVPVSPSSHQSATSSQLKLRILVPIVLLFLLYDTVTH